MATTRKPVILKAATRFREATEIVSCPLCPYEAHCGFRAVIGPVDTPAHAGSEERLVVCLECGKAGVESTNLALVRPSPSQDGGAPGSTRETP